MAPLDVSWLLSCRSALRGTCPQAGQRRNSVALGGCSKIWPQLPGPWPLLSGQVDPWAGPRGRMSCDCPASMMPFSNQQAHFRAAMACTLDFSTWGERDSEQGQGRDLRDHRAPFLLEGKNSPRVLSEPFGLTSATAGWYPGQVKPPGPRPPVGYNVLPVLPSSRREFHHSLEGRKERREERKEGGNK